MNTKHPLIGMMALATMITGCQSTSPSGVSSPSDYSMNSGQGDFNAINADQIAAVRTQMAGQLIRERKLDAAQRQLDRALQADKNYAPAYDMMGVLLQQEGSRINRERADGYFRRAIELDPNFMQARNNYGVYLAQMNRHAEAVKHFELAGSALGYEGRIGALENLGRTALVLENESMAVQAFLRALDADTNSLIAHVELVDLLIKNNRIDQAQKLYNETISMLGSGATNDPRILLQGIKLAHALGDSNRQNQLAEQLFSNHPLSQEAKKLKEWMTNPKAVWQ